MKTNIPGDRAMIPALGPTRSERAGSDAPLWLRGDHCLASYRTLAGKLMCLARCGPLMSEIPFTVAHCGAALGRDGAGRCLVPAQAMPALPNA